MQRLFKGLRILDWTLAGGLTLWGVATANPWLSALGVLSLALVVLNPAARIKRWLERKFLARRTPQNASDAVVVAEALDELARTRSQASAPQGGGAAASLPDFSRNGFAAYASPVLSPSRHNRLTAQGLRLTANERPYA
jgi:hypothetical protein